MTLPNFLVIGAMKSATSSLCEVLSGHPQVFISDPEEPEFFCRKDLFGQGLGKYETYFAGAGNAIAVGEGSTSYTKSGLFPGVAERISQAIPDMRLIYILRDPVRRIESHWLHTVRSGNHNYGSFSKDVSASGNNYVDTSLYWKQRSEYLRIFKSTQIKILFYEDFQKDPSMVIRECCGFLGIDSTFRDETAAEPRHVSLGSIVERPIVRKFQENPVIRRVFQAFPRSFRNTLKRPFQQVITEKPQWTSESLEIVLEVIREDAEQILAYAGKPKDYWSLQTSTYMR